MVKQAIIFSIVGLILFSLIGVGVYFGVTQGFFGERYVEIPVFASIECRLSGVDKSIGIGISKDGRWISDVMPRNTNSWDVVLQGSSGISAKRFEYYICPSRSFCSNRNFATFSSSGGSKNLGRISSTSHIWVQYQTVSFLTWKGFEPSSAKITYTPFSLIRDDPFRGGRQEISDTCIISTSDSSWLKRIVSSESSEVSVWGGSNSLKPGDFYNYITTNVLSVIEGNTQEGGWCVYENNQAKVFAIEELKTGDGTNYNRVNFDKIISRPECCNGASIPGGVCKNGNFIPTEEVECNTRADCGITEWIPGSDPTTVQRPQCVNNQCTFETKSVDCTIDLQCSTNEFCSRNTFTCEIASDPDLGPGDGREVDDDLNCNLIFQEVKPAYTSTNIFGTEKQVEASCKNQTWVTIVIILAILMIIVLIVISYLRIKSRILTAPFRRLKRF